MCFIVTKPQCTMLMAVPSSLNVESVKKHRIQVASGTYSQSTHTRQQYSKTLGTFSYKLVPNSRNTPNSWFVFDCCFRRVRCFTQCVANVQHGQKETERER